MSGIRHRQIRKFSPGTYQSDQEVKEQFVVREHELDILLHVLRGNFHSPSCQHALIVAPRGRGKTMLMARVAAEIRTNTEFRQRLLPVCFMEENLEIFSLTDFWLETLFHLARECTSLNPQLADELRNSHVALSERWREQTLEDLVRAVVLDAADRLNLKLVLMVENLQDLCKDVDTVFGWKLRDVLQMEPQIILIASATARFAGLADADQPFFEMFRTIDLKPLTTEQCRNLWEFVSGDKMTGRGIRSLEIISGGSPRLLVIIAGLEKHKSLRRLMEELVMLIDEHTEYFRGYLDSLGRTERRVYIAVLDLWRNSTPGEIAARARMDVRVVSTMLGRLLERGALVVEGGGRKRKYAAAEPLHCIYYKLRRSRNGAAVVENLIRFMEAFYSADELREFGARMTQDAQVFDGNALAIYRSAFGHLVEPPSMGDHSEELLFQTGESSPASSAMLEMLRATRELVESGQLRAALDICDEVIQRLETSDVPTDRDEQVLLAQALSDKGAVLSLLNRYDQALVVWNEVVRRFEASNRPALRDAAESALCWQARYELTVGGRESVAIAFLDRALMQERAGRPDTRMRCHLVRAQAYLAKGDNDACAGDIGAALSILPELDMLPRDVLVVLAELSAGIGTERMRGLIGSSPASDILLPLMIALERELGLEPRVAREVEEVAKDIRLELFDLRKDESR